MSISVSARWEPGPWWTRRVLRLRPVTTLIGIRRRPSVPSFHWWIRALSPCCRTGCLYQASLSGYLAPLLRRCFWGSGSVPASPKHVTLRLGSSVLAAQSLSLVLHTGGRSFQWLHWCISHYDAPLGIAEGSVGPDQMLMSRRTCCPRVAAGAEPHGILAPHPSR